jgi:hypothetical protein
VDERPACSAVAIDKRMDGLELGVCERSLRYSGQRVVVAEPA